MADRQRSAGDAEVVIPIIRGEKSDTSKSANETRSAANGSENNDNGGADVSHVETTTSQSHVSTSSSEMQRRTRTVKRTVEKRVEIIRGTVSSANEINVDSATVRHMALETIESTRSLVGVDTKSSGQAEQTHTDRVVTRQSDAAATRTFHDVKLSSFDDLKHFDVNSHASAKADSRTTLPKRRTRDEDQNSSISVDSTVSTRSRDGSQSAISTSTDSESDSDSQEHVYENLPIQREIAVAETEHVEQEMRSSTYGKLIVKFDAQQSVRSELNKSITQTVQLHESEALVGSASDFSAYGDTNLDEARGRSHSSETATSTSSSGSQRYDKVVFRFDAQGRDKDLDATKVPTVRTSDVFEDFSEAESDAEVRVDTKLLNSSSPSASPSTRIELPVISANESHSHVHNTSAHADAAKRPGIAPATRAALHKRATEPTQSQSQSQTHTSSSSMTVAVQQKTMQIPQNVVVTSPAEPIYENLLVLAGANKEAKQISISSAIHSVSMTVPLCAVDDEAAEEPEEEQPRNLPVFEPLFVETAPAPRAEAADALAAPSSDRAVVSSQPSCSSPRSPLVTFRPCVHAFLYTAAAQAQSESSPPSLQEANDQTTSKATPVKPTLSVEPQLDLVAARSMRSLQFSVCLSLAVASETVKKIAAEVPSRTASVSTIASLAEQLSAINMPEIRKRLPKAASTDQLAPEKIQSSSLLPQLTVAVQHNLPTSQVQSPLASPAKRPTKFSPGAKVQTKIEHDLEMMGYLRVEPNYGPNSAAASPRSQSPLVEKVDASPHQAAVVAAGFATAAQQGAEQQQKKRAPPVPPPKPNLKPKPMVTSSVDVEQVVMRPQAGDKPVAAVRRSKQRTSSLSAASAAMQQEDERSEVDMQRAGLLANSEQGLPSSVSLELGAQVSLTRKQKEPAAVSTDKTEKRRSQKRASSVEKLEGGRVYALDEFQSWAGSSQQQSHHWLQPGSSTVMESEQWLRRPTPPSEQSVNKTPLLPTEPAVETERVVESRVDRRQQIDNSASRYPSELIELAVTAEAMYTKFIGSPFDSHVAQSQRAFDLPLASASDVARSPSGSESENLARQTLVSRTASSQPESNQQTIRVDSERQIKSPVREASEDEFFDAESDVQQSQVVVPVGADFAFADEETEPLPAYTTTRPQAEEKAAKSSESETETESETESSSTVSSRSSKSSGSDSYGTPNDPNVLSPTMPKQDQEFQFIEPTLRWHSLENRFFQFEWRNGPALLPTRPEHEPPLPNAPSADPEEVRPVKVIRPKAVVSAVDALEKQPISASSAEKQLSDALQSDIQSRVQKNVETAMRDVAVKDTPSSPAKTLITPTNAEKRAPTAATPNASRQDDRDRVVTAAPSSEQFVPAVSAHPQSLTDEAHANQQETSAEQSRSRSVRAKIVITSGTVTREDPTSLRRSLSGSLNNIALTTGKLAEPAKDQGAADSETESSDTESSETESESGSGSESDRDQMARDAQRLAPTAATSLSADGRKPLRTNSKLRAKMKSLARSYDNEHSSPNAASSTAAESADPPQQTQATSSEWFVSSMSLGTLAKSNTPVPSGSQVRIDKTDAADPQLASSTSSSTSTSQVRKASATLRARMRSLADELEASDSEAAAAAQTASLDRSKVKTVSITGHSAASTPASLSPAIATSGDPETRKVKDKNTLLPGVEQLKTSQSDSAPLVFSPQAVTVTVNPRAMNDPSSLSNSSNQYSLAAEKALKTGQVTANTDSVVPNVEEKQLPKVLKNRLLPGTELSVEAKRQNEDAAGFVFATSRIVTENPQLMTDAPPTAGELKGQEQAGIAAKKKQKQAKDPSTPTPTPTLTPTPTPAPLDFNDQYALTAEEASKLAQAQLSSSSVQSATELSLQKQKMPSASKKPPVANVLLPGEELKTSRHEEDKFTIASSHVVKVDTRNLTDAVATDVQVTTKEQSRADQTNVPKKTKKKTGEGRDQLSITAEAGQTSGQANASSAAAVQSAYENMHVTVVKTSKTERHSSSDASAQQTVGGQQAEITMQAMSTAIPYTGKKGRSQAKENRENLKSETVKSTATERVANQVDSEKQHDYINFGQIESVLSQQSLNSMNRSQSSFLETNLDDEASHSGSHSNSTFNAEARNPVHVDDANEYETLSAYEPDNQTSDSRGNSVTDADDAVASASSDRWRYLVTDLDELARQSQGQQYANLSQLAPYSSVSKTPKTDQPTALTVAVANQVPRERVFSFENLPSELNAPLLQPVVEQQPEAPPRPQKAKRLSKLNADQMALTAEASRLQGSGAAGASHLQAELADPRAYSGATFNANPRSNVSNVPLSIDVQASPSTPLSPAAFLSPRTSSPSPMHQFTYTGAAPRRAPAAATQATTTYYYPPPQVAVSPAFPYHDAHGNQLAAQPYASASATPLAYQHGPASVANNQHASRMRPPVSQYDFVAATQQQQSVAAGYAPVASSTKAPPASQQSQSKAQRAGSEIDWRARSLPSLMRTSALRPVDHASAEQETQGKLFAGRDATLNLTVSNLVGVSGARSSKLTPAERDQNNLVRLLLKAPTRSPFQFSNENILQARNSTLPRRDARAPPAPANPDSRATNSLPRSGYDVDAYRRAAMRLEADAASAQRQSQSQPRPDWKQSEQNNGSGDADPRKIPFIPASDTFSVVELELGDEEEDADGDYDVIGVPKRTVLRIPDQLADAPFTIGSNPELSIAGNALVSAEVNLRRHESAGAKKRSSSLSAIGPRRVVSVRRSQMASLTSLRDATKRTVPPDGFGVVDLSTGDVPKPAGKRAAGKRTAYKYETAV